METARNTDKGEIADFGTRRRLFLAAESLIAERGFEAVSSRDITGRAGTNLAAINYYFGSKNNLLLEIFRERASEMNSERAALLRRTVARDPQDARGILLALIQPSILWNDDSRATVLRFLNRARSEGPDEVLQLIRTDVRHLRLFADALIKALPHLGRAEVIWRLHFTLGVLHHNSDANYARLRQLSEGHCTPEDREALLQRQLDYIAAGFGL